MLESYSVSLPKKSRQGDSLTSIYLCNLTKNLRLSLRIGGFLIRQNKAFAQFSVTEL